MQKILFQSYFQQNREPGEIFTQINNQLVNLLSSKGYFFTSACLLIDVNNMELKFSIAAHPDIILIHDNGEYDLLPKGKRGTLIGVFEDYIYKTETFPLKKNDRMVLYSDGIPETFNPSGQMYGDERFITRLLADKKLPVQQSIDNLIEDLYQFKEPGHPVEDDITLLIIDIK